MIKVLSAGLLTTIQDQGRRGSRSMGVPVSGVMDRHSADLANALLGNFKDAAVLECTLLGPTLLFYEKATIVIAGAHFQPKIDGKPVQLHKVLFLKKNATLNMGSATKGMYGYIAIQGGFISQTVLASQSFYNGITKTRNLKKGEQLNFDANNACLDTIKIDLKPLNFDNSIIEVLAGPEFKKLSEKEQKILLKTTFKISPQSNRMAIVFEQSGGVAVSEILTAPVQPGTVQITPSGNVIILMRDAQTTGGYGRIFQLTEASMNQLSQQRPGSTITLKLIK